MDLISLLREEAKQKQDAGEPAAEAAPDVQKAFGLAGQTAIVTGAGSGIGRGIARVLAGAGATVVCADLDPATADETADLIRVDGGIAKGVAVDVTQRADVGALVASTISEFGQLDVMCNNAGIIIDVPVLEISEDQFDRVFAVNFKGALFGCQEAGAAMVARGRGSIINIASTVIDSYAPKLVAYGVSKVGVVQLTRTIAAEVGGTGVRVNVVAPGFVETNISRRHYRRSDGSIDEDRRKATLDPMREMAPLKEIGRPEDIGYAVLYLASDASRFLTGQIIRPNGGSSMPW